MPRWISTSPTARWRTLRPKASSSKAGLSLSGTRHQQIRGFGGCFNELGWFALQSLKPSQRKRVLDDLFLPGIGCSFSYCRMPIGASDFGLEWYSLNERDGDFAMRHFSIERDKKILIPYIKEALRRRSDITLFASPWSPPTWMKFPKAYNYGKLRWEKKILDAYALYFLKLVQSYGKEGIRIHQVHPQNEPVADQKFPSCLWTGAELRDFIRDHLGPLMAKKSPETEIWLGTLNTDDYDGFPLTVMKDPGAAAYVKGIAYQWAGKHIVQKTLAAYPKIPIMQSENECGDGQNTWDYAGHVYRLIHHYLTNGTSAYVYWNMVLPEGGKSTWGWPQNSMISVDLEAGRARYNPEFHVMRHFSHFVAPGAVLLGLRGEASGNALSFENPSGEKILVVNNPFSKTWNLVVDLGSGAQALALPPQSFNTVSFPA